MISGGRFYPWPVVLAIFEALPDRSTEGTAAHGSTGRTETAQGQQPRPRWTDGQGDNRTAHRGRTGAHRVRQGQTAGQAAEMDRGRRYGLDATPEVIRKFQVLPLFPLSLPSPLNPYLLLSLLLYLLNTHIYIFIYNLSILYILYNIYIYIRARAREDKREAPGRYRGPEAIRLYDRVCIPIDRQGEHAIDYIACLIHSRTATCHP